MPGKTGNFIKGVNMIKGDTPTGEIIFFNEEDHKYFTDKGMMLDSVTQILEAEGYIDTRWFKEEYAFRGTMVHKAIEAINRKAATFSDFRNAFFYPYIEAYMWFVIDTGFKPDWIEKFVCNIDKGIAGCLDITGTIRGKNVLIDVKTGSPLDWHPIQLAAYARMGEITDYQRYDLHLRKNARYTLKDSHKRLGNYNDPKWIRSWKQTENHWNSAA